MADLSNLSDDALDAEHERRVAAVVEARAAYRKDPDDAKAGRALLKARERADESQAEVNARRGAPPSQMLS